MTWEEFDKLLFETLDMVVKALEDRPNKGNCEDYKITGTIGYKCPKCGRGNFLKYESNCVYCGEPLIKTDLQEREGE